MVNSSGTSEDIYVSLRDKNGIISDQSCENLVNFLNGIDSFKELHKRVREMSDKKVITKYETTVTGDGAIIANNSENSNLTSNIDNRAIEINSDQHQQIKDIVDTLLSQSEKLSPNELLAIARLNRSLENKGTEKENGILTRVWNGLNEGVGFASDATQVVGFVQENWVSILAIITTVINNTS